MSVTEQRYRAVLEVQAGLPVSEVAERFGVSRQTVRRWLGWYRDEGLGAWGHVRAGGVRDGHRVIRSDAMRRSAPRRAGRCRVGWCRR
ncbi:helix-turn-helix domain-containing protein [Micromonospora eburnea]|uniref:helix-turn-helix domain-containing protein n=2 Tax=Micromonospora eburnea TaxID=227316 RepID=UPI003CC6237E